MVDCDHCGEQMKYLYDYEKGLHKRKMFKCKCGRFRSMTIGLINKVKWK